MTSLKNTGVIYFVKKIRQKLKNTFFPKRKILSRVACLGQDICKLKFGQFELINQQKVRVDLYLEWMNGATRPDHLLVKPFMQREDIYPLIVEESELPWLSAKSSADLFIMDSFAELTDQKFTHKKEGWFFTCNYTDIQHTEQFEEQFESNGLLSIDLLEMHYQSFFSFIFSHYPEKKVLFFHFPTALDNREKFKERGGAILQVIEKLSGQFSNLVSISIPEDKVFPHEGDDFPYHYSAATYESFIKELELKN